MLFSSMIFIWVFLPITLIIYYLINLTFGKSKLCTNTKNIFLFLASLIFYAWGNVYFVSIMIASIIINFLGGIVISSFKKKMKIRRGIALFIVISLNLAILIYFKYFNMIIAIIEQTMYGHLDNISFVKDLFNLKRTYAIDVKDVLLPIGISFFTFQAMSYVIDVYRGITKKQSNIFNFGLYVALFPQLIAGPIVKYQDVEVQINNRKESSFKFLNGVKRFCYGLGKKVIIANTCAYVVDNIWALDISKLGFAIAWLAAILYTFQIYYDFSGYSDMAIGLGKMFGFDFKENFNYPYMADSIIDFWRRWHISLTSWFREYVYIPLGGSKRGTVRTCINIFIVFLLTGIWHGANFTFIAWGISYAILEIIERLFLKKVLDKNPIKIINFLYTILIVMILWIPFRANNINDAITFISQLFIRQSNYQIYTFLSMKIIIVLILAILGMGIIQKIFSRIYMKIQYEPLICGIDFIIQLLILSYSIILIISGTYNPFIYFQF